MERVVGGGGEDARTSREQSSGLAKEGRAEELKEQNKKWRLVLCSTCRLTKVLLFGPHA